MFITPKIRERPLARRKRIAAKEIPLRVWTIKNSIIHHLFANGNRNIMSQRNRALVKLRA
jgi:hypothetical protein